MELPKSQLLISIALCLLFVAHTGYCAPSSEDNIANDENYEEGDDYEDELPYTGPPPVIETKPMDFSAKIGQSIAMPCEVKNAESIATIWKHGLQVLFIEETEMTENKRLRRLDNKTLVIDQVRPEDAGRYYCHIALNPKPIEIVHTLTVIAPPTITNRVPAEEIKNLMKHDSLTLTCGAIGTPTPTIVWTRSDNKPFPNGEHRIEGSSLSFPSVDRHYSGQYVCTARNEYGTDTAIFKIQVHHPPEISLSEDIITTRVGIQSEIICTVHANPPAKVKWYHNGQPIGNSPTLSTSHNGNKYTLSITVKGDNDFGSYACYANNSLGSGKKAAVLSGAPTPPKIIVSSKPNEVPEITWTVQSHLPVKQFELNFQNSKGETKRLIVEEMKSEGHMYTGQAKLTDIVPGSSVVSVKAQNEFNWSSPGEIEIISAEASAASFSVISCWVPLSIYLILRFLR